MSIQLTLPQLGACVMATALAVSLTVQPGQSAERVYVNYGPIERSISVEALETYARTGELNDELRDYSRYFSPQQLEQLRQGLLLSANVDVVAVSQFLYTTQGEAILAELGELVQTPGRRNGAKALRGALIQAAADPNGGLNAINVLKYFATPGVRLDLREILAITERAIAQINQTRQVTAQIQSQAAQTQSAIGFLPELTPPGGVDWQQLTFDSLALPTDLYLPAGQSLPLVVLSHGLGGSRETLAYLAEHLASYGFAVAVVEHPGSSTEQLNALLSGQADEAVDAQDLVRRPTAIRAVLDQLSAQSSLQGQIDFQNVGVLGQSLGAYTTLALAGATVSSESLAASCPPGIVQLNLSLLLQCSLSSLPGPLPELSDQRVRAAIALNPFSSAVFGPAGMADIDIPLMLVSGSADTVTPALAEQIRPFTWLDTSDRYLLLIENGTHFSTIFDPQAPEAIALPQQVIGPRPDLAQRYVKAISVAFFQVYLNGAEQYRPYLSSTYAETLSRPALPLALTKTLTLEEDNP